MRKNLRSKKQKKQISSIIKLCLITSFMIAGIQSLNAQKTPYPLSIVSKNYKPDKNLSSATKTNSVFKAAPTAGSWTALTHFPAFGCNGGMILLSDGTVLAKSYGGTALTGDQGNGTIYTRLTPDASGSYVNGTWSTISPMQYDRLYYSSQVLKDGRLYVAGGEYGGGLTHGEVYDPLTNTWTLTPDPGINISDANSEILEDGRVLQALVGGDFLHTVIYNPATNTYSPGPSTLDYADESAWLKLPDNSILYIDVTVNGDDHSTERYIPATNSWIADATVPVSVYDPYGFEAGGAFLLPDGRGFFLGSTGHTAYYTPSGTTANGAWTAGPDIPNAQGTPDAAAAMMVNGKILCAVSPIPTSGDHFPTPTSFYEFDYLTNSFTQVGAPGGGTTNNNSSYISNMLDLPDGTVLFANQGDAQYYIYTPNGAAVAAGKPAITGVLQTSSTTYNLTGTGFNGISEGACYGDDWQSETNFPVVRLTLGSNVYYCRTTNWNSTGVMRGNKPDSVTMTLPAGLPDGTYSMVVTANGIASNPVSITTGCEIPNGLFATNLTTNSATLNWNAAFGGLKYALSYKPSSSSTWTVIKNIHSTSYNLTGLAFYTSYDYKVQTTCANNLKSAFSHVSSFATTYGGPAYCAINGSTGFEYINKVVLGSIHNTSGNNFGYGNYTALSTTLAAGSPAQIKLTPGFTGSAYPEYWEVYIDYNHNGTYNNMEKVATGHNSATITKTFTVPLTAKSGLTNMRIVMHYNAALGTTCGSFTDGEAEDYTVNITGGTIAGITGTEDARAGSNIEVAAKVQASPNPNKGNFTVQLQLPNSKSSTSLTLYDAFGKKVWENNLGMINGNVSENVYLQNKLASGLYMLTVQRNDLHYSIKVLINK